MTPFIIVDLPNSSSKAAIVSTWQPGHGINTGGDLRRACSPASGRGGKIACVYFLNGVLNDVSTSIMAVDQHSGKPFKPVLCVPPTVKLDAQIAALVSAVDAQPRLAGAPAAAVIRFVYGRTWACKP